MPPGQGRARFTLHCHGGMPKACAGNRNRHPLLSCQVPPWNRVGLAEMHKLTCNMAWGQPAQQQSHQHQHLGAPHDPYFLGAQPTVAAAPDPRPGSNLREGPSLAPSILLRTHIVSYIGRMQVRGHGHKCPRVQRVSTHMTVTCAGMLGLPTSTQASPTRPTHLILGIWQPQARSGL